MEHQELLSHLAKINHDNGRKWKDTSKLDAIKEVLTKESPYHEIYEGRVCSIWSKTDELPKDIILMSTHIDTVKSITKPFSELKEGIYKGTYDNLATNAAFCALMMEENLPDNVVFTFDGDEETGCCHGLKDAVKHLQIMGHNILYGIAADVTYEGFYENKLSSVENMTGKKEDLAEIFERFRSTEPDNMKTFSFVPLAKDMIPENGKDYFDGSYGMMDEAFIFKNLGIPGCSICVPTEGAMHSDSGLQMKEAVFEGYILSLATAIYSLTHTHDALIEAYKVAKENLTAKAAEIVIEKPKPVYYGRTWYFDDGEPSDHVYSDESWAKILNEDYKNWKSMGGDNEYIMGYDDEDFDFDDFSDEDFEDYEKLKEQGYSDEEIDEIIEADLWNKSSYDKNDYSWDDEMEIDESSDINRYGDIESPFDLSEEEVKKELESAVEKEDDDNSIDNMDDWDYGL